MDRIEGLLNRLTWYQNEVTYYSEVDDLTLMREAQGKRNRLSTQIADEWRGMYEALEAAQCALAEIGKLATVNEGDVITMLPYHARKLARLLNDTRPVVDAALTRGES